MKIKLNKNTISTILWLLGELISLLRKVSKENKGNDMAQDCGFIADHLNRIKFSFVAYKYGLENVNQYEESIKKS